MTIDSANSDSPPNYYTEKQGESKHYTPRYSALSATDTTTKVVILCPDLVTGSTPETAYALVLRDELTIQERAEVEALGVSGNHREIPQYCGRLLIITKPFKDVTKTLFAPDEPAKGHIDKMVLWFCLCGFGV
ncbi:hypothetical protein C8R43DRAFT_947871 [Mycena crocata]|nr:hypothetical protein C8R43DRAFT_947871 [Mycena crocata]